MAKFLSRFPSRLTPLRPSARNVVFSSLIDEHYLIEGDGVGVTSGQKRSTEGVNIANFYASALNIFTKEIIKCQKEHLKFM